MTSPLDPAGEDQPPTVRFVTDPDCPPGMLYLIPADQYDRLKATLDEPDELPEAMTDAVRRLAELDLDDLEALMKWASARGLESRSDPAWGAPEWATRIRAIIDGAT